LISSMKNCFLRIKIKNQNIIRLNKIKHLLQHDSVKLALTFLLANENIMVIYVHILIHVSSRTVAGLATSNYFHAGINYIN